ncbi:MAG: hypothetical protein QXU49_04890 [Candidatus Caldarchaeum sp.]
MTEMISLLLVFSLVLANAAYVDHALSQYWLIGFGGEQMLPFLDGGVLTARIGESLTVRLMGRNGAVTIKSPQGLTDTVFVQDGTPRVLKKFTSSDVGEWSITTDDGLNLVVAVEQPVFKPSATISFSMEGNDVVMSGSAPPQGFILFQAQSDGRVFTPGSKIEIALETVNTSMLRFDLLRNVDRISYGGRLHGTPYSLELDQLVLSQVVQGRRRGGLMTFSINLPKAGVSGPSGLRVLSYGQHIARLVTLGESRVVYQTEITIIPESLSSLKDLTKTVRASFWEAFERNYTVVVGDELGNVWLLNLRPPLAALKVYDSQHNLHVDEYELFLEGSTGHKVGGETLLTFYNSLDVSDYWNGSFVSPSRTADIRLGFKGAVADVKQLELKPGYRLNINLNLLRLVPRLVYPNGTLHQGPRTLEINGFGVTEDGEKTYLLPSQTYVINAVNPGSFSPTTFTLTTDTTVTVIVVDNPAALASLRISAILMTALLGYAAYRLWMVRKTFYQPHSN